MLGNIRIDGLNQRFPRRRSREVVTYLAVHRNGVDPDALTEAVWPDAPPLPHRIIRYLSEARTTLGDTPTGDPYLPPLGDDGLYRVHPRLGCDLDRLEHHLHQAKTATEPNHKARHLRAGLVLVEGPPFTGGTNDGYSWAHTEGLVSHATIAIDNAAHQLAEHALQHDDPDTATWAA